ncbi:MAG TPA: bifunctional phosphoribosylaminoimidazolecarboxamide formyltransferase/IMP cyclohydrolase [Methanoregulaceae archaeon]|nr:bifunctional phosphoribosylaminoimidazolecarboxamide formyltransferase/IMP cyclohydrolase [Methanoregulaceae archaeon]
MRYALLSVWDKEGLVPLAGALVGHGYRLISSGGTGKALADAGIPFVEVSAHTGSPEMMGGRVKTLHPRIHGGLLGRRGIDDRVMAEQGIEPIDLVVVNLYPFEAMRDQGLSLPDLVEYIDIGGPAMIRAAAKNYRDVGVVVDPAQYPLVIAALERGGLSEEERLSLARAAFARTAAYDAAISNHLHALDGGLPAVYTRQWTNGRPLRYGENPHQQAAVYGDRGVAGAVPLQGREMSYNNYLDLDAAVRLVAEFEECAAVIVKHNNPCGAAVGPTPAEAYVTAREVDPVSAYGGVVALNRPVDADVAREVASTFVEVIGAPGFSDEALNLLAKKTNLRVIRTGPPLVGDEVRTIDGGLLVQRTPPTPEGWRVVTRRPPTAVEEAALRFGLRVAAHTKSNAIVFANERQTLGIGAGQMSRVDAARIAIEKARQPLVGSGVASDAFLPFPDTLEVAAEAGATALVQPGGSIRDDEVIAAADRLGVAMVFTGVRHFRH